MDYSPKTVYSDLFDAILEQDSQKVNEEIHLLSDHNLQEVLETLKVVAKRIVRELRQRQNNRGFLD